MQNGQFQIGTGTSVITPFLEMPIAGYYFARKAQGVHDHLYAKALVVDDGQEQIALVACDNIEVHAAVTKVARTEIQRRLGIAPDHVLISATHSHTGPKITKDYEANLVHWIVDCVTSAAGSKRPASLFVATELEASLPHNRRYWMKDGTVATNPGFLNPNVVKPVGPIDPRVGVLWASDASGQPIATWVNYALHLDTVGGDWIAADYPYYLGRLLARAKGADLLTLFAIGACGDINHWDVRRPGPQRGANEAQRIGEVLGASVIKACSHPEPIPHGRVQAWRKTIHLPPHPHTRAELAEARRIATRPIRRDVDFELDRVKADRILDLEARRRRPYAADLQILTVGPVAFVAVPGELFVELGLAIQQQSPFPQTFVLTFANDHLDYIATRAAFDQGGYEPTSSRLAPEAGEQIVAELTRGLQQLHKR